jgi:hypothetical protein
MATVAKSMETKMFIRFVVHQSDTDSGRRQGLFQAMAALKEAGELLEHEQDRYCEIYGWFRENLKVPSSFTRSSKPHAKKVALSWFKYTATAHIAKMREMSDILRSDGVAVDVIRSVRPGYLVYEDDFQVAAEPFQETVT